MNQTEQILSTPLDDLDKAIAKHLDDLRHYPHRLKLAVALCMLTERATAILRDTDDSHFPADIKARIGQAEKAAHDFLDLNREHLFQNARIEENVDAADSRMNELRNDVQQALDEFDRRLSELINIREQLQLSEL